MRKISIDKKEKNELDTKKVNLLNKELKRINDLLAITMVRQVIHQINVGVMGKKNSMESATIVASMVIGLMNAKKNLSFKEIVTNVRSIGTNLQNEKLKY